MLDVTNQYVKHLSRSKIGLHKKVQKIMTNRIASHLNKEVIVITGLK